MAIASPASFRSPWPLADPSRLALRVGSWESPALLEGGPELGAAGRWSVYAARPRVVIEATDDAWRVQARDRPLDAGRAGALEALGCLIERLLPGEPPAEEDGPFTGGLIGFFGYDLAPRLERLPRRSLRDSRLPDIRFALYDTVVAVDHWSGRATLWAHDFLGEGAGATRRRGERWLRALGRDAVPEAPRPSRLGPLASNFTRDEYLAAVRRCLDYIAAGDVFQVNLSQRFEAAGSPEPLDLYARLRAGSPAPFGAFLRWGDLAVVGASPEWFYQTRGDRIVTRPIKGTRPRGRDPEDDRRLAAELAASPKDRAELTMIVDLERNDLGRICRYGTIDVTGPLTVESFAQVHHLVATIEGRLRPEVGPIEVVRALFPGGSITGAPKIRAMEIIDELEPTRRGLYTGAIGYFGPGGASGFNIAIRTMVVEGHRVCFQVGGGIVADSDPEAEYLETLHKGRGLRAAIEAGGPSS